MGQTELDIGEGTGRHVKGREGKSEGQRAWPRLALISPAAGTSCFGRQACAQCRSACLAPRASAVSLVVLHGTPSGST